MSNPYLAEIRIAAFNFQQNGWAFCGGQLMSISQNTALFSLLGTTYGGNGQTTFALPDLRGRAPIHHGNSQGPGLSNYSLGQTGGETSHTLSLTELPIHNHGGTATPPCSTGPGTSNVAAGKFPGITAGRPTYSSAANTVLSTQGGGSAGGSQPHENQQPYLTLNFMIALQGVFPSRN